MAITLTVSPASPTSSDTVGVTVAGPLGCAGGERLVMSQVGHLFTGYVDYGGPLCYSSPPPLLARFTLGSLAPGTYTVTVADPRSDNATTTTSFFVTDAYTIPTVQPAVLIAMALAIVLVA